MTVQELYQEVGGNYDMIVSVLQNDAHIEKYLKFYLADESFSRLSAAVEQGDVEAAFDAAHALKGVSGMLSLTGLYQATFELVEQLRAGKAPIDLDLFRRVEEEQTRVVSAIGNLS